MNLAALRLNIRTAAGKFQTIFPGLNFLRCDTMLGDRYVPIFQMELLAHLLVYTLKM